MSDQLPSSWSIKPLSDLAEIVSGGTPSRDIAEYWKPEEIEWVTPTDITRGNARFLNSSKEKISRKGLSNSSAKLLPVNTVLMTSRATLGEMKVSAVECCTNQGFKSLVPKSNTDVWFLYYQMMRKKIDYEALGIGSTFLEVNKKDTDSFKIEIPPFEQQQKIANILSTVDNLIELTQSLIDKYTDIKQGMMADLFTRGIDLSNGPDGTPASNPNYGQLRPCFEGAPDLYKETELGWVPKEWEVHLLNEVTDVIDPNPKHRNPIYTDEGFPFISTAEFIKPDSIELETKRRVAETTVLEQEKRCFYQKGSIAFSRKGTIGETRFLPHDIRFALLDSVCIINAKEGVEPSWIIGCLRSSYLDLQLVYLTMGVALKQVSVGRVREILVPLCPLYEQKEISNRLKASAQMISVEMKKLNKYKKIKKGLMQDLLTGKVKVN